jgi:type VI secretion system protein ImpE
MDAAELLKQARLEEALAALQQQVRNDPADPRHRIFLFQLLAVLGRWDKALTQLNLAAELDPKALLMAQVCRQAIQCEALRAEVFAGQRTPLVFGQPQEWVAWMIQAAALDAQGGHGQAAELRSRALEAAPAVGGRVDDAPFAWLADADPRLGPILEAVVDGKYFWVPMQNIARIALEAPTDLRDLVWLPATFTWGNGGTGVGLVPARYPGTEGQTDGALRLARRTEWQHVGGLELPIGQRLLVTDAGEYPLLGVRKVVFEQPA